MDTTNLTDADDDNTTYVTYYEDDIDMQLPPNNEYFQGLNIYIIAAMVVGSLLLVSNIAIFLKTTYDIRKKLRKQFQLCSLILTGVYPVICLAAFLVILFPRWVVICHTLMHFAFVVCAYAFYKLCFLYVAGEDSYLKNSDSHAIQIRTPPLCCCCLCYQSFEPTKTRLCIIYYMIVQMLFFQTLIMIALLIVDANDPDIYDYTYTFFSPFIFGSILIGVWGLNIVTRMLEPSLPDYKLRAKFICLQLILICCKLQPIIFKYALLAVTFGGVFPITDLVYKNVIVQVIILIQMTALSLLAGRVYQKPTQLTVQQTDNKHAPK